MKNENNKTKPNYAVVVVVDKAKKNKIKISQNYTLHTKIKIILIYA